jgi:hypothetical protein
VNCIGIIGGMVLVIQTSTMSYVPLLLLDVCITTIVRIPSFILQAKINLIVKCMNKLQ